MNVTMPQMTGIEVVKRSIGISGIGTFDGNPQASKNVRIMISRDSIIYFSFSIRPGVYNTPRLMEYKK